MANFTNESFLEMLQEEYSDVDFDNLPPLEEAPTVYYLWGMKTQTVTYKNKVAPWSSTYSFVIHGDGGRKEFPTIEEAEAYLEEWKKKPFSLSWTHETEREIVQQTVDPSTMKIASSKPDDTNWLHIIKEWKDRIADGEKVFPMYLP